MTGEKLFTNKQFGEALELYYNKGYNDRYDVGKFLNHVFKLDDKVLDHIDTYSDACMYFKKKYTYN